MLRDEDGTIRQRFCDMDVMGGGWTLVAAQAPQDTFPVATHGLDDTTSFGTYTAQWQNGPSFFSPFHHLTYDSFLIRTADGLRWCVVSAAEVRAHADNGDVNERNTRLLGSHGGVLRSGQFTTVAGVADSGDVWLQIGCDGTVGDSINSGLIWGEAPGSSSAVGTLDVQRQHRSQAVGLLVKNQGNCCGDLFPC